MLLVILLGLPVGLAFGYAAQRGRFCINSAFRDVYLVRDSTVLRQDLGEGVWQIVIRK